MLCYVDISMKIYENMDFLGLIDIEYDDVSSAMFPFECVWFLSAPCRVQLSREESSGMRQHGFFVRILEGVWMPQLVWIGIAFI